MAGAAGAFGYGLGNFVRSYMDQEYKNKMLAKEEERLDIQRRSQEASEAERGLIRDVEGAQRRQHPSEQIAPIVGTPGTQSTPEQKMGLLSQQAGPVVDVPSEQMLGFIGYPEKQQGMIAQAPEPQGLVQQPPTGLVKPPEQEQSDEYIGNFRMAPWKQKEMEYRNKTMQRNLDMTDPNSDVSKTITNFAREMYKNQPGLTDNLFGSNTSAQDVETMLPHLEKFGANQARTIKSAIDAEKYKQYVSKIEHDQALADRKQGSLETYQKGMLDAKNKQIDATKALAGQRLGIQKSRFGEQQSKNAAQLANRIHTDKVLAPLQQAFNITETGTDILKGNPTVQEFNDVMIEYSNSIAGARGSALGKLERTEYDTFKQKLSKFTQWASGKIPTESVPPDILARARQFGENLNNTFSNHMASRAESLYTRYPGNPAAEQAQIEAIRKYSPTFSPGGKTQKKKVQFSSPKINPGDINKMNRQQLLEFLGK